jgi:hypothetical protein
MQGKKGVERREARRPYRKPQLRRRNTLCEVTEGPPPPVTDGAVFKGGCFGQDS